MKRILFLFILLSLNLASLAQTIAAGAYYSLSVCKDGSVSAWGLNDEGQLGNGTMTNSNVPVQVPVLDSVIAVAGGGYYSMAHSMALKQDGTIETWETITMVSLVMELTRVARYLYRLSA